jgi:hypothetical protein
MMRRSLMGLSAAVALAGVVACVGEANVVSDSDDEATAPDGDADAGPDGDTVDGSTETEADADVDGGERDGESAVDAGVDAESPRGEPDAASDAGVESDAATVDAATESDASTGASADAGTDPSQDGGLPDLAAHYTFDENAGTVAADSAGDFADALLENGASFTDGVGGSALELAGGTSENYLSLPANLLDRCDDITIALWMKLGSTPFWSRLLDLDGGVDGFLYFTPAQDVGGVPHLFFNIFHPPGEGPDDQGVSAPYPDGTTLVEAWHHVASTLSVGTGRLYFDGVEIGSNPMAISPADLTLGENAHAWIGRSMFPDPYLDAAIDDLRISCAAYTTEQVAALAQ